MTANLSLVIVPSTTMSGTGSKFGICWSSEEALTELLDRFLGEAFYFLFETRLLTDETKVEQGWSKRLQNEGAFIATSFNAMDSAAG